MTPTAPNNRPAPDTIDELIRRKAYALTDGKGQGDYAEMVSHLIDFAHSVVVHEWGKNTGEDALEELDRLAYEEAKKRKAAAARRECKE